MSEDGVIRRPLVLRPPQRTLLPLSKLPRMSFNTLALLHGDAAVNGAHNEVAPSISVSTTFLAHPNEGSFADINLQNPERHVYSRYTQDVSTRVEHILNKIMALVYFKPKRIAIQAGYFGCHHTIEVYKKCRDIQIEIIDLDDEYKFGDLCWLETPVNPTGTSRDIQYYADKIHKVGGKIVVDSTFAPPPLQYPFKFGADCILHSATKYLGGHSDLLAGLLVVKTKEEWEMANDRTYLGSMMGNLESWLLLRSLRTFHLRIVRQSTTATELVQWLKKVATTPKGDSFDGIPGGVIAKVFHSSLQGANSRGFDPRKQLEGGWPATFSISLTAQKFAEDIPFLTKVFVPATSLGSVESLIERRARGDPKEDPTLIRLSIGLEDLEDLKDDLRQALAQYKH
ncbi:hypothetical protein D9757_000115 [Collybiopsis confluens]|uniref:Cystathionine gamma-synthase n=1 Tax=Collybiopsis confluens TaxID=2823264 RepID=A0A8H5I290_9AGAR|nr:hypothetical protein D9757_000115 [Collybiopsis confluens]